MAGVRYLKIFMRKKILIVGDSFSANWSIKYKDYLGWPDLLASHYDVTNVSQAGVSEYKILKQLRLVGNVKQFDCVILSHTCPYRVNTRRHPVHYNDSLHEHADLIYSDINYHAGRLLGWLNRSLISAKSFFVHHFDMEYQEIVYQLIKNEIAKITDGIPTISLINRNVPAMFIEHKDINLTQIQLDNQGHINHLSEEGNIIVYKIIKEHLKSLG